MRLYLAFLTSFWCFSYIAYSQTPEFFGHRGFRGLYPENSLIGFQKAIELGITGVELDVVVNKDRQLVVSHEPYFQRAYCIDSASNEIQNESDFNIYELTQDEISKFDCGSKFYSKFPEQQKLRTVKPLFQDFIKNLNLENTIVLLEIKSNPREYGISQPEPPAYSQLILNELKNYPNKSKIRIMSFDHLILEELHKNDSSYPLIYLTYLPKSPSYFIKQLTFKPYALGMFYPTIKKRKAVSLHKSAIKLYAWTVNSISTQKKLLKMGVDGIITDFPNLLR
jgi:glycerophosphoryl diester phosphodiesterase